MNRDEEFEKWYDEYFADAQGEDSPFSYNDVKMAFYKGYSKGKENLKPSDNSRTIQSANHIIKPQIRITKYGGSYKRRKSRLN